MGLAIRAHLKMPFHRPNMQIRSFATVSRHYLNSINKSGADKFIISSESFFGTAKEDPQSVELIKNLFRSFHVKVVVYLRRQDQFFESNFSQSVTRGKFVKTPVEDVFNRIYQRQGYNYMDHITPWEEAFGRENIIVRSFEKTRLLNADVVQDFFGAIGADFSVISGLTEGDQRNITPPAEAVLFMNQLNRLPMDKGIRHNLYSEIIEFALRSNYPRSKSFISPLKRNAFIERFRPSNEAIEERYLPPGEKLFANFESEAHDEGDVCTASDVALFAADLPARTLTDILVEACRHQ